MHLLSRAAEINALVQKAWEAKEQADKDAYIKKVTGGQSSAQSASNSCLCTMLLPSPAWGGACQAQGCQGSMLGTGLYLHVQLPILLWCPLCLQAEEAAEAAAAAKVRFGGAPESPCPCAADDSCM